jgi:hypothetical protein
MKAIFTRSEYEPPPPVILTEQGCLRAGDAVRCRVRRCESAGKEGEGFNEPWIDEFDGVLERPSLFQPMWWVRSGDGLRFVWNDEMEKMK